MKCDHHKIFKFIVWNNKLMFLEEIPINQPLIKPALKRQQSKIFHVPPLCPEKISRNYGLKSSFKNSLSLFFSLFLTYSSGISHLEEDI